MGSTGPNFTCPWCGRSNVQGFALDGINYPICSEPVDHSCLDLVLNGITRNGIRAGALYRVLIRSDRFQAIHAVQPSFFLELCDLIFGHEEDSLMPLVWTQGLMSRMFAWNNRFIEGQDGELNNDAWVEAIPLVTKK